MPPRQPATDHEALVLVDFCMYNDMDVALLSTLQAIHRLGLPVWPDARLHIVEQTMTNHMFVP